MKPRSARRADVNNPLLQSFGLKCWFGYPGSMQHFHRHNEVELNFILRGAMTYLFGGRVVKIPRGRLGLFWAPIPHRADAEPQTAMHWLCVPLGWLMQRSLPEGFVQRLLRGEVLVDSDDANEREDERLFERWAEDLRSGGERRQAMLLELEARLRRLSLTVDAAPDLPKRGRVSAGEMGKAERMAGYIAEHYGKDLSIADVAVAVGLHPNYAMTLFKKTMGVSLLEYVTQHRLSHAQRLLATTDAKMLEIAMDAGFGSSSRFYAAFQKGCGCSPRVYRARLRA